MTNRRRRAEQLAIVVAGILLVLGVNQIAGGDAPSTATEDPSTAAQYRRLQSSVCGQQSRAMSEVPPPRTSGGFASYVGELVQRARPYVDRAETIIPPPDLQAPHDRYVASHRRGLAESERLMREARATEDVDATVARWTKGVALIRTQTEAAIAQLGLENCHPSRLPASEEERQSEPPAPDPSACRGWDDEKRAVRDELSLLTRDARENQKTIDGLEEEVRSYPEDRSKIALDLRIARRDLQDSKEEITKSLHEIEVVNDDARSEGCGG